MSTTEQKFFESRGEITEDSRSIVANAIDIGGGVSNLGGKGSAYQYTKTGRREDLGDANFRSRWESNFARVCLLHNIVYEFEPTVFTFPIKRGVKGYTPDFYLTDSEEFVELKGYLDPKSKTKLKRFKKYYPAEFESLVFVVSRYNKEASQFAEKLGVNVILHYENMSDLYKETIVNWEGK